MERTMVPPQLDTLDIFKAAEYVNNNIKDSSKISLKPAELLYEKINADCDNLKYYSPTVSIFTHNFNFLEIGVQSTTFIYKLRNYLLIHNFQRVEKFILGSAIFIINILYLSPILI